MKRHATAALVGLALGGAGLACAFQPGDLNCDGARNAIDHDSFVLVLTTPDAYTQQFPYCSHLLININHAGAVDAFAMAIRAAADQRRPCGRAITDFPRGIEICGT